MMTMRHNRNKLAELLLLTCALAGCAHGSEPAARSSAPRAKPPAQPSQARDAAPAPKRAAELEPAPPFRLDEYMYGHFVLATWSRDAVMHGALDALRQPLQTLAEFDYGSVVPVRWMARVTTFQETARLTARAPTLEAAASGVAALAIQCGDCHSAEGQLPYEGPEILVPPQRVSLPERMGAHILAADQMWDGLTVPSVDTWNAGAAALARLPNAFDDRPATSPAFADRLTAVRQLGVDALDADTPFKRADVYARLMLACSACHADADADTLR